MSRPYFILKALFALSVLLASACTTKPTQAVKKESGPVGVKVVKVSAKTIQRTVEGVGTLYPLDEAIISAEVDGRLEQVSADLGDAVQAGQSLARISDEEQRYMVAQQEAQLRQSLERLGLRDEKDKVADIRQTPDVRRARADLSEAESRFRRTKELVDQGIGPKSDLDQYQSRFQAAQAAYDQTLNQTRNLIQEVERFKAGLELQRKKLRDTNVRAPYAAYIKDRQAVVGAYVRANTPLFTLVKIDPIRLRIEVPERMAPWVKVGQKATVSLEAFADRTFQGTVSRISPTVDQTKRTFVVEALIDNNSRELKPGSYARARLNTDKSETIHLMPVRAVSYVLGTNKAYVVKQDNTVDARTVKLGDRFEQQVEVLEGVSEGELVAVSGLSRLETGTRVQIQTDTK